jgi:hypothetical protein
MNWRQAMNESRFTPGPWVATLNRDTGVEGVYLSFDVDGDRGSIVRGQSAEHLKIDGQNDDPIMAAECEANARLIAAAPELLEALKMARLLMVEIDGYEPTGSSIRVIDSAIAKATGEQA